MVHGPAGRLTALLAALLLVLLATPPVSAADMSAEAAASATPGVYEFLAQGFRPHEKVSTWLTGPNGEVIATDSVGSDRDGGVYYVFPIPRFYPAGQWAMTGSGWDSGRRVSAWFDVVARGPDIPLEASQPSGPPGTTFAFTGGPVTPDEVASYWANGPDGQSVPGDYVTADANGRVDFAITVPANAPPGVWSITLYGPKGDHMGQTTVTVG